MARARGRLIARCGRSAGDSAGHGTTARSRSTTQLLNTRCVSSARSRRNRWSGPSADFAGGLDLSPHLASLSPHAPQCCIPSWIIMEKVEKEDARQSRVINQRSAPGDGAVDIKESRIDIPDRCEVERSARSVVVYARFAQRHSKAVAKKREVLHVSQFLVRQHPENRHPR